MILLSAHRGELQVQRDDDKWSLRKSTRGRCGLWRHLLLLLFGTHPSFLDILLCDQTIAEIVIGLVCPTIQESVHGNDVVTHQLQKPEGQVARIEQIMVMIVHRELAPGVSVDANHRFGSFASQTVSFDSHVSGL